MDGHADFNRFRGSGEVLEQCHYEHNLMPRTCTNPASTMRLTLAAAAESSNLGVLGALAGGKQTITFKHQVPPQAKAGSKFDARHEGTVYEVTTPAGATPGDMLEIDVTTEGGGFLADLFSCCGGGDGKKSAKVQPGDEASKKAAQKKKPKGPQIRAWLLDKNGERMDDVIFDGGEPDDDGDDSNNTHGELARSSTGSVVVRLATLKWKKSTKGGKKRTWLFDTGNTFQGEVVQQPQK